MKISEFSIKHPAIITMILIALVVFGIITVSSMQSALLPKIEMPSVMLVTTYPGASPHEVENDITNVLEEQLAEIPGIDSLVSTSYDSVSVIEVAFNTQENIDLKLNDIRDKLNNATSMLPDEVLGLPQIYKMNSSSTPIYTAVISSNYEQDKIAKYAEDVIKARIARIPGVAQVTIRGQSDQGIFIELDPFLLQARGVTAMDVYQLLQYNNVNFPGGDVVLEGNSLSIRTKGAFSSLEELENMVVTYQEGSFIRLKDIAVIEKKDKNADFLITNESKPAIILNVMKQANGDDKKIISKIHRYREDIFEETDGQVEIHTIIDNSVDISKTINSVIDSALQGAILAIIILLIFLHDFRTTFIVFLSIPFSIFLSILGMKMSGISLNLLSLTGMTVALGMIVDSSIVFLENTYNHYSSGMSSKESAVLASKEVGGAIVASTTTSLSVFVPMLFMTGFAGAIMKDIALTMIFALGGSMITAVVIVPYAFSLMMKHKKGEKKGAEKKLSMAFEGVFEHLSRFYQKGLKKALGNRLFVIILAILILVASGLAFNTVGFEFFAAPDMSDFEIYVECPMGFTLDQTKAKMDQIEEIVKERVPEVTATMFYSGLGDSGSISGTPNRGYARVRVVVGKERGRSIHTIINDLQDYLPRVITDANITVKNGGLAKLLSYATGGDGYRIEVAGQNWDDTLAAARAVSDLLAQDPDVTKTEIDVSFNRQELVTDLDLEQMGTLGITPYEAGITSRIMFNGMDAGTFRDEDRDYDIQLKSSLAKSHIRNDILNSLFLRSGGGNLVSFGSFASLNKLPTVDKIPHRDRMRSIYVTGYMSTNNVRDIQSRIVPAMEKMDFPTGVQWKIGGSAEMMSDTFGGMLVSLFISVFLVYMVMVIQFERFSQPLVILASVPFSFIGVILGLGLFGSMFSIISFCGVIALGGMVVNNAIVLVDYTNLLRTRDEMPLLDAVLKAGNSRLKPILMTTLTTILGLLPLALGLGEGSEVYASLGQAIGGGLLTSTLITLFIVPVLYYSLENRHEKRKQNRQKRIEEKNEKETIPDPA